ncbi:hypothetical protein BC829DRAFT_129490 [Chytridium lagenaria]|nr:hypothetical protein BC829DRAFT_129490 [Chytridium lagenaria]
MQIIHRNPRELHIPLMQIQGLRPYVPSYVYDVACGKERRDMVTEAVAAGSAFCEDGLGCLVLVTVLGVDMLQTQRVGRHLESLLMDDTFMAFSKIMDTVSVYEGDIVYVHADSILICFDAKNDKGSSLSVAGQRAVACCADIVLGFETDSPFFGPHAIDSVESLTSLGCPPTKVKAVASYGPIRHIILGSTMRYEYGICSDLDFEGLNNATDFGEIGITKTLWEAIGLSDPIKSSINPLRQRQLNDKITYETDALLSVVQSLDRLMSIIWSMICQIGQREAKRRMRQAIFAICLSVTELSGD